MALVIDELVTEVASAEPTSAPQPPAAADGGAAAAAPAVEPDYRRLRRLERRAARLRAD